MNAYATDILDRCADAARRARFDAITLNAQLATLDRIGRQRALTDAESRELERLLRIKDRRDERRIMQGGKPMEHTPRLTTFAGVPVRAMEDAMRERQAQIADFGHTPETDLAAWHDGGTDKLGRVALAYCKDAADSMAFGRPQLRTARLKSIKAIAALLAQVDLIDAIEAEDADDEGAEL